MNLLLYPSAVRFKRRHRLPPGQFQYLEGCVRKEPPYVIPEFKANEDGPLLYVSFGSLGAGDIDLLKRLIAAIGRMPVRALVNVGDYLDRYTNVPPNVIVDRWFPQPSVIPKVDAVIHHGGNNSFTECLYFGKPALIMPYVWDGHDNAMRVQETGHGFKLDRYGWTDEELRSRITALLTDRKMRARLRKTSKTMRSRHGSTKAARVIDALMRRRIAPGRRSARAGSRARKVMTG
jgi:MGT family glycosyltransferase